MSNGLKPRQERVARMFASGHTRKVIMREVGISRRTLDRWATQADFQQCVERWRAKQEAHAEARLEDQADLMAKIVKREQENYQKALGKLGDLLETAHGKELIAAFKELREAVHAKDKHGGDDMREMLSAVIAGKFGDRAIPLPEPMTTHSLIPRPDPETKH